MRQQWTYKNPLSKLISIFHRFSCSLDTASMIPTRRNCAIQSAASSASVRMQKSPPTASSSHEWGKRILFLRTCTKKMHATPYWYRFLVFFHFCEAFTAVYRAVFSRSEWHFCFSTTGSTGGGEHFSLNLCRIFASLTAVAASLRFVLETSFRIEFLFAGGEYEFISAFFAYQSLVLIHF